jgi:prophage antirepressor-like protein
MSLKDVLEPAIQLVSNAITIHFLANQLVSAMGNTNRDKLLNNLLFGNKKDTEHYSVIS